MKNHCHCSACLGVHPHSGIFAFLILFLLTSASATAQWQRVDTMNIGVTGGITVHGNSVFQYGSQQGFKIYRSTNNGSSWENISAGAPSNFSHIYSYNGELFAVYLGNIYVSTNNGDSWSLRSSVTVTGNGALWGLTSNGNTLYAFSNRKSYFVSTNNGMNWDEVVINDSRNILMINFAVGGGNLVAVFGNVGALVSTDNGTSWKDKNPATFGIAGVYSFNDAVYGFSFGSGLYKIAASDTGWIGINTGIADNGLYQIPKSMTGISNVLYVASTGLLSSQTKIYTSDNGGGQWTDITSTGLPPLNSNGGAWSLSANGSNLFALYYGTGVNGVYVHARTTSVRGMMGNVPDGFELHQNYPNPFNPATTIRFSLLRPGFSSLKIFDLLGNEVAVLVNQYLEKGSYNLQFDASHLGSSLYLYRLAVDGNVQTKKMTLIK